MTCKGVLLKYFKDNKDWHKKVSLYVVAESWSPETVGRALRLMQEDGELNVSYYKGRYTDRKLARYILAGTKQQFRTVVTEHGTVIKIPL